MATNDIQLMQFFPNTHIEMGAVIPSTCRIDSGCTIGAKSRLGQVVRLDRDVQLLGSVILQRAVVIGHSAVLVGPLEIGEEVILAAGVKVGVKMAVGDVLASLTRIRQGAHIGVNAEVMGGVILGEHCRVRAGSRVLGDVPAYGLAGGDPAILENFVCSNCSSILHPIRRVNLVVDFGCPACGQTKTRISTNEDRPKPGHVLLPGGKSWEQVSMIGSDPRWDDGLEMRWRG
ncbi:MAG: DapH/DapD/GlmU-related protein [Leptolinea sp.]